MGNGNEIVTLESQYKNNINRSSNHLQFNYKQKLNWKRRTCELLKKGEDDKKSGRIER